MDVQNTSIIKATGLTKRYGELLAVDHIDFTIHPGTCVGFLGPNGAGKTSTVKMMYCVSPVTDGQLTVIGMDVMRHAREIKCHIGVVPQENNLDPDFTVFENLMIFSRYYQVPKTIAAKRADKLMSFLHLDKKRDVLIDELSGGMRRRLIIARALMNEPKILILDEPTTGLDPQARHAIWNRIRSLKKEGITIILTTHYMDEAAQLCDSVIIMNHGKIIAEGEPESLVMHYGGSHEVLEIGGEQKLLDAIKHDLCDRLSSGSLYCEDIGDRLQIYCEDCHTVERELSAKYALKARMIRLTNLEDVFLRLTGRRLDD